MIQTPDNFEFLLYPKIISGTCALENIPSELNGYDARKPLVITSRRIVRQGLVAKLIKAFYDSTIVIGAVYDEVLNYAGISQAQEAAMLFSERGCDAIIAVGNGAVVDLAKAVNVLVSEKTNTLKPNSIGTVISRSLKPLFLVPTGGVNGWETTDTMTVDNRRVSSEFLFPATVMIDPRMTVSGSPEEVAASGAVILAQAFVALSQDNHNPMIDAMAHPALNLLSEHLAEAVRHPENRTAGLALANAAVMAGAVQCNLGPALTHLLAETLSAATGISAGQLTPILLSAVIAIVKRKNIAVRDELCLAATGFEVFSAIPREDRSRRGLERVTEIIGELQQTLPRSLQALRIQPHLLEQVAEDTEAASERRFTAAECRAVLRQAWENVA